jgi:hypothetical protein
MSDRPPAKNNSAPNGLICVNFYSGIFPENLAENLKIYSTLTRLSVTLYKDTYLHTYIHTCIISLQIFLRTKDVPEKIVGKINQP